MPEEINETITESTAETQQETPNENATSETKASEDSSSEDSKSSKSLLSDASEEGGSEETDSQAPEAYDFKLPEGVELDQEMLDTAVPVFKEMGLSQDNAQKLVDMYTAQMQKAGESLQSQQAEAWDKQITEWREESKKYFGADLKENLAFSAKFMDKFGDPDLREVLDQSGLGNHPSLIKLFARAGKLISNDSFADSQTNTSSDDDIDLKKLYPSMKE